MVFIEAMLLEPTIVHFAESMLIGTGWQSEQVFHATLFSEQVSS